MLKKYSAIYCLNHLLYFYNHKILNCFYYFIWQQFQTEKVTRPKIIIKRFKQKEKKQEEA